MSEETFPASVEEDSYVQGAIRNIPPAFMKNKIQERNKTNPEILTSP